MARPDRLGLWILKWIVGPLLAIMLIAWGIHFEMMKRECRRLAEREGYLEGSYVPGRMGSTEQCVCRKKVNEDGTIDERASHTFKMN